MKKEKLESTLDNKLFKNMIQNNWVAVTFANMNNVVEYVNSAACELYGYEKHELLGETTDIFNSQLSHNTDDIVSDIKEKGYWSGEIIQKKKDNTTFQALLSVQMIFNDDGSPAGFASNSKDISDDISTAKKLERTIEEKELLLKELHHRVKNNLAIIKGIISLQESTDLATNCKEVISDFKNRIDAVAALHNTLYEPGNLDNLDLKRLINDVCSGITRSFGNRFIEIKISNIADNYTIDVSKAAPLCLIINEVITNSFKHAFNNSETAEIRITLCTKENIVKIMDNGVGFNFNEVKKNSLGMTLIKDLSEQIDAKFEFLNSNGTSFLIYLS